MTILRFTLLRTDSVTIVAIDAQGYHSWHPGSVPGLLFFNFKQRLLQFALFELHTHCARCSFSSRAKKRVLQTWLPVLFLQPKVGDCEGVLYPCTASHFRPCRLPPAGSYCNSSSSRAYQSTPLRLRLDAFRQLLRLFLHVKEIEVSIYPPMTCCTFHSLSSSGNRFLSRVSVAPSFPRRAFNCRSPSAAVPQVMPPNGQGQVVR